MFLEYLNKQTPLNIRTKTLVQSAVTVSKVRKKNILQVAGTVCRKFHFVENGILREFYYKDERDVTAWFVFKGMTASCIDSLFSSTQTLRHTRFTMT